MAHRQRAAHKARHPVHVTLRAHPEVSGARPDGLRARDLFAPLRGALAAASKPAFRVTQFSVQADHVHLLVEAHDEQALARGMQGLAVRAARAVNRVLARRGALWADRYHARPLTTPREVRHGLVYVLQNWRKHRRRARGIDPCSSGPWFDGWRDAPPGPPRVPVAPSRTWLASVGWRRHGLVDLEEAPAAARPP